MQRYWDIGSAFDNPFVWYLTLAVVGLLALTPVLILTLSALGKLSDKKKNELILRTVSWVFLCTLIFLPIMAGQVPTILAITALCYLCFYEFSRATGIFRQQSLSLLVIIGIAFFAFATLDHWYNFFNALAILTTGALAALATLKDEPKGYIQRVALGCFSLLFFGYALGHLSYMANDKNFRAIILLVIFTTEINDVFAYLSGNLFGKHKLSPKTSPNKTIQGAIGAIILTTILVVFLGSVVFAGTVMGSWTHLVPLGLLISCLGILGDLMMSSIKRDLGIKDMGSSIPGHGGVLDRFDSLILVAPAVFHYVGYFIGFGLDQPTRLFTGAL